MSDERIPKDSLDIDAINALIESTPIVAWDVERPIDYEKNNKVHTPESLKKLGDSIKKLGQIDPILVDRNGVIISGHGRRAASRMIGLKKIQVRVLDVDERRAKEIRLAANLTVNQKYDTNAITEEVRALLGDGGDLSDLGESIGLDDKLKNLIAPDLTGALDMKFDMIAEDVGEEVILFQEENDRRMKKTDESEAPIAEALGFKRAKPHQLRAIRKFMAQVKAETQIDDPAEALVAWIEELSA